MESKVKSVFNDDEKDTSNSKEITLSIINNVSMLFLYNETIPDELEETGERIITIIQATIGPLPPEGSVIEPPCTTLQLNPESMVDFTNLPIDSVSCVSGGLGTTIYLSKECDIEISQMAEPCQISYGGDTEEMAQVIVKEILYAPLITDS